MKAKADLIPLYTPPNNKWRQDSIKIIMVLIMT